jgi:hypothetical protein
LQRHKDQPFHGVVLRSQPGAIKVQVYWLEGTPDEHLQAALTKEEPM